MKKLEALEILNKIADDQEIVVRTNEDESAYLDNYLKTHLKEEVNKVTSQLYTGIENDIFEAVGIRKQGNEKAYDFNKKILRDLKEKAEAADTLNKTIADLQEKIKNGEGDKALRKALDDAKAELDGVKSSAKSERRKLEEQLTQLQEQNRRDRIKAQIEASMIGVTFKPHEIVPEAAQKALINQTVTELLTMGDFVDDKLVFKSDKGEVIPNPTTLNPKTAAEMVQERLKDILDTGHQQTGTGTKAEEKKKLSLPAGVADLNTLIQYLDKQGIQKGSEEYTNALTMAKEAKLPTFIK